MFSGIKMWVLLLAGLAILAMVGAAVGYHLTVVHGKDTQITELTKKNEQLTTDKTKLEVAVASKDAAITQRDAINKQMIDQLTQITERDAQTVKELKQARQELSSVKRNTALKRVRASKKAELLLKVINKSAACETAHFGEAGTCRNGQWVPR